MNSPKTKSDNGLTRLEVMVLVVVLAVLALLALSVLEATGRYRDASQCSYGLNMVGAALRNFATDHNDRFPMQLALADGGTRDFNGDPNQLWRHFQILSNDFANIGVSTPKFLSCPADRNRQRAETFSASSGNSGTVFSGNQNLSYFLGLGAWDDTVWKTNWNGNTSALPPADPPCSVLSGDRNLTADGVQVSPGRFAPKTNSVIGFSQRELHKGNGNLLRGDGSVWHNRTLVLDKDWFAAQTHSPIATNVWLVP